MKTIEGIDMQLEPLEYIVNKNMGDETITITRKALEKWYSRYANLADTDPSYEDSLRYQGKEDLLVDLLKYFDEEESL